MFTINRVNAIHAKLGWPLLNSMVQSGVLTTEPPRAMFDGRGKFIGVDNAPGHAILDRIDRSVGIDTRKQMIKFPHVKPPHIAWRPALLGERLARLERHIFKQPAPQYFHLGAQAEEAAA